MPEGEFVQTFWQDLRYGARMLMKEPGFTLASVIALALGIGANIAIFSVMMTVLVRPLPFREPESLVYLWNKNQALGVSQGYFTEDDILAFRERATSCAQIAAWTITGVDVRGLKPERVEGMLVSSNFFQTLGVATDVGSRLSRRMTRTAPLSATASGSGSFGGDPNMIGQEVSLADVSNGRADSTWSHAAGV